MNVQAVLLLLGIALLAPSPGASSQREPASFMLAVLRRDGLAVPFAAFDGKRWSERWPDRAPREVPIALGDVPDDWWGIDPPPRRMHLWTDGARAGAVELKAPAVATLMCQARLALRSDYRATAPVPAPFVRPYPKDGLLVAGDAAVSTIAAVDLGGAEAREVLALATDEFNQEEAFAAGAFRAWRHPVPPEQRRRVPITLEALYRAPTADPAWTAYFLEAVRQFPPTKDDADNCGLATYVSGWVIVGPGGRTATRLAASVTYCDRKGVGYMLPFGVIHADGKAYWVIQHSGFEVETYEVIHPSSRGVDTEVVFTAGTCG